VNIISIALKEIKQDFRDLRTLLLMLAFPIVLMLILGSTLSNAFSNNVDLGELKVLVNDTSGNGQLSQAFTAFTKEMDKVGMKFDTLKPGMDGSREVEQGRYVDYVELKESGISLYGSSRNTIESNIVQGMLTSFTDKYNAAVAVAQIEPTKVEMVFASGNGHEYIKETSINAYRLPDALDYYALVMTVMVAMWSAMSAARLIQSEVKQGTAFRLITAPVSKGEIFTGKVLGSIMINMLCILVIILFSKYVFQAYWGTHLGIVLLVLLSLVIMAISFGLAGGYLLKSGANGMMMLIVQLASIFGGAYFPIGDDTGVGIMSIIIHLSPIRVANHALTQVIYGDTLSAAWPVIGLNMTLSVLFIGVSIIMMKRREGL
jgi:ABC-2 type transport system permease protein